MRPAPRAVLLVILLCASACGPKVVRETVFAEQGVHVELRRLPRQDPPASHAHPVTIADVRMAHILASLSHRDSKGNEHATIRAEHVYPLAEGIARAAARATPQEEIAAAAFPADRKMVVFETERVTSFRAYFEGRDLVLEFYAIEDRLEVDPRQPRDYTVPLSAPSWRAGFTLVGGGAQALANPQTLRVDWRDRAFSRPVIRAGGRIRRRTILLEQEDPAAAPAPIEERPAELDDAQTRALDQLEAARRSGVITESEYLRRRGLVLDGRLEEAGYGSEP